MVVNAASRSPYVAFVGAVIERVAWAALAIVTVKAAEVVDPQASEDEPIPCSPEAEALLSEFMAAADWGGKPTTEVASSEPALTSV